MTFIKNPNDMNILFDSTNFIHESCVLTMCQNIEEIVQRITEFMVCLNFILNIVNILTINIKLLYLAKRRYSWYKSI